MSRWARERPEEAEKQEWLDAHSDLADMEKKQERKRWFPREDFDPMERRDAAEDRAREHERAEEKEK